MLIKAKNTRASLLIHKYIGVCQTSHVEKGHALSKWVEAISGVAFSWVITNYLFVPYSIFIHTMIVKLKIFGFPFQHAKGQLISKANCQAVNSSNNKKK